MIELDNLLAKFKELLGDDWNEKEVDEMKQVISEGFIPLFVIDIMKQPQNKRNKMALAFCVGFLSACEDLLSMFPTKEM
jgi:hypothetical protein